MRPKINALIVGAGGFGRYYAQILSQLNNEGLIDIPIIDKLILTKTRLDAARILADTLSANANFSAGEIIAAEVSNSRQLVKLLEKYTPQFTGITALDPTHGNRVHATYTMHALNQGSVLCEKPFSDAAGDGSSLAYFDKLSAYEQADLLGLELPMAVVMRDLCNMTNIQEALTNATSFGFWWETPVSLHTDIINDLALHPWSLIPENFKVRSARVDTITTAADITLDLYDSASSRQATCKIVLKTGGTFRGIAFGDRAFAIRSKKTSVKVIELKAPLATAASAESKVAYGKVLLEVENPLKQNIAAVLQKRPIVNIGRAYESQLFLEVLHGYRG